MRGILSPLILGTCMVSPQVRSTIVSTQVPEPQQPTDPQMPQDPNTGSEQESGDEK